MRKNICILILLLLVMNLPAAAGPLDSDEKISLEFEGVAISTVLDMLAQQHNLNLVQSGTLQNRISIKLENVSLKDALNAILASNGYNYYVTGNIIVVKPLELNAPGETIAVSITLDNISPAAAVNAATDMLSPKGKIKIVEGPATGSGFSGKKVPTQIVIVDLPEIVELVLALIRQIDKPEKQVAIEVRMIETNIDTDTEAGFKWPTSLTARGHGISPAYYTGSATTEAMGQIDLPNGKWDWGKLSVNELKAVLEFLETSGNSKLISDPKITTLNNHEAEIKVTTVVPIQTINRFSEGGSVQDIVTYQDEEVGISLLVTPHITEDGQITLDVRPTVAEIIGFAGPSDNQKPITSQRSIQTTITVKNNETAVLGGLLRENKIEKEQRIFFVGSLPIIGNLFKHKSKQTTNTDLTILITPRIIED